MKLNYFYLSDNNNSGGSTSGTIQILLKHNLLIQHLESSDASLSPIKKIPLEMGSSVSCNLTPLQGRIDQEMGDGLMVAAHTATPVLGSLYSEVGIKEEGGKMLNVLHI
ncbi:hypothetical protein V6N13_143367 [Hibiscus sabdariffa]|uniref:Uncharacterized protein n=1 Tax=Hibiscus sabdariffa TaxID=183260 RepID=A0ABR2FH99_9ROSI